jgi:hypothetical protein
MANYQALPTPWTQRYDTPICMAEQAQFLPIKLPLGTTSDSHTLSAAYSDSVSTSSISVIVHVAASIINKYHQSSTSIINHH